MPRWPVALLLTLLLYACGGTGSVTPLTSVTVAPANAQLVSGGAPVTFTATLIGATAPVSWTLTGPGNLSSTVGTSVIYTPPATLSADSRATLLVAGGGASAEASIALIHAAAIVVTGDVVDLQGNPAANITVSIGTRSTVTGASGRFTLEDVHTPYTLAAVSVERSAAVVYQGLTRADPTIRWREAGAGRRAEVQGTITGGAPVSNSGVETVLFWAAPGGRTQSSTSSATYSLPVHWSGPSTISASVHVLQESGRVLGLPTAFPGYAERGGVTVADGATTSSIDVALTVPTSSFVHGRYTLPEDYVLFARILALGFPDGAFVSVGFDDGADPEFTYAVPGGIGAAVEVLAEAGGPGADVLRRETGIPPGATDVAVALPRGAASLAPADTANDVDVQTEFSWESFPDGVYLVDLVAPAPGPTIHVVTRETRSVIPQLAALPLPSRVQYRWTVTAIAPFQSLDDAAGPEGFEPAGNTLLESFSDGRTFVTR